MVHFGTHPKIWLFLACFSGVPREDLNVMLLVMLLPHDSFHAEGFVRSVWGQEDLPDRRLFERLVRSATMLLHRTSAPTSEEARAERRGFQRFYRNERIDPLVLSAKSDAYAIDALRGLDLCIVAHDTTEVALRGADTPEDAGVLRSSYSRGYLLHDAIALHPGTGVVLAWMDGQAWTRGASLRHQDHRTRTPQQRESIKWRRGIRRVERKIGKAHLAIRMVHVMDSEGTTHENFLFAVHNAHKIISRVSEDRLIAEHEGKLWAFLEKQPSTKTWTTTVRTTPSKTALKAARLAAEQENFSAAQRAGKQAQDEVLRKGLSPSEATKRARKARLAVLRKAGDAAVAALVAEVKALGQVREVDLAIRHAKVTLTPKDKRRPVRVQAVLFQEISPPDNVEPVEWMLLTNYRVKTAQDALQIGCWYKMRYCIEDIHKVLKTGLHMEDEPFENIRNFQRYLAVAGPIAAQLVRWREASRVEPHAPASNYIEQEQIETLKAACRYRRIALPRRPWTIADFILRLAQLGGYERRPDRHPGWLVIWRGWRRLEEFAEIYQFAQTEGESARRKRCVPK